MRGFTLVELVVVLGIGALLAGTADSGYRSVRAQQDLNIATTQIVQALRHAKAYSEAGVDDSVWGVYLSVPEIVVFKGSSYGSRVVSFDQPVTLPGGVVVQGLPEVTFAKGTGTVLTVGTTTISNSYGTKSVHVNQYGTVSH